MAEEKPVARKSPTQRRLLLLLGAALLLVQFVVRADDSIQRKSPVWDETLHMDYGALFLKFGPTFDAKDHPYPYAAFLSLPMAGFSDPALNHQGKIAIAHPSNLWSARRMNLALATLGLGLIAWLIWGLWGQWVAMAFLLFGTLDPGWIAQARFATTDIAHGLGFALVPFLILRFGPRPNPKQLVILGTGVFLALSAKFSGLLLLPLVFLHFFFRDEEDTRIFQLKRAAISSLIVAASTFGMLLLVFELHALLGRCSFSEGPGHLWNGFTAFLEMRSIEHGSVLLGSYHDGGTVLYFPVLFLSKTPMVLLALILGGLFLTSQRQRIKEHKMLFLIPVSYLLISMFSGMNSGYRHMTPVLPFLWLIAAWALSDLASRVRLGKSLGAAIALLLFLEVSTAHPHYLPFTNQIWGGQDAARHVAVNAASDWGQDLPSLTGYLRQNPGDEPIHLAYFGRTDPALMGIQSVCRPCGGLGFQCPEARPHDGCNASAKTFAISATCLEGAARKPGNNHGRDECYEWLRGKEPDLVLGGSILIFKNVEGPE